MKRPNFPLFWQSLLGNRNSPSQNTLLFQQLCSVRALTPLQKMLHPAGHGQGNHRLTALSSTSQARLNRMGWTLWLDKSQAGALCQRVCATARCPGGIPTETAPNLPLKLKELQGGGGFFCCLFFCAFKIKYVFI